MVEKPVIKVYDVKNAIISLEGERIIICMVKLGLNIIIGKVVNPDVWIVEKE